MKTLTEQPSRMRLPIVVVRRQRTAGLAVSHNMPKIAAFRGIDGERRALGLGFSRDAEDRGLAAAFLAKTIGSDPPAGEIICREFPDRHRARDRRRECVRGIVILMRAFERRHPNRLRRAADDRRGNVASSSIQVKSQAPRGRTAKPDDFDPEQPRRAESLLVTPPYALTVARPVPRPESALGGHASRQIQNENARPGRDRARSGDRAGNDLVIRMRR